jgi:hypothetical protein
MKTKISVFIILVILFFSNITYSFDDMKNTVSITLAQTFPPFTTMHVWPYSTWPDGLDLMFWELVFDENNRWGSINVPIYITELSVLVNIDGSYRYRAIITQNGKVGRTINVNDGIIILGVESKNIGINEVINFQQPEHELLIRYFMRQ